MGLRYRLSIAATAASLLTTQAGAQETVIVEANGSQVELPADYAGGQIARGGRIGLFGNLDIMDTPFNSTNYTAEFIRNNQASSVADVVLNDPGVRVARGFGNFQELYVVRGFPVYSDDVAYNGLYGLLPRGVSGCQYLSQRRRSGWQRYRR
jgi:iron complex outermembrane recepter protein